MAANRDIHEQGWNQPKSNRVTFTTYAFNNVGIHTSHTPDRIYKLLNLEHAGIPQIQSKSDVTAADKELKGIALCVIYIHNKMQAMMQVPYDVT